VTGPSPKWLRRCVECRYVDRTGVYVEPPYSPSDQACPVCGGVVFEAVSSEDLDKADRDDTEPEWWQGHDLDARGSRSD
jgi:hypothetical protein